MELVSGRARRGWAWASAAVGAATTTLYVVIISGQGLTSAWALVPWLMVMSIGTGASVAAALASSPAVARFSALAAVVILGVTGALALLTIGAGFLTAAALAGAAAGSVEREAPRRTVPAPPR